MFNYIFYKIEQFKEKREAKRLAKKMFDNIMEAIQMELKYSGAQCFARPINDVESVQKELTQQ